MTLKFDARVSLHNTKNQIATVLDDDSGDGWDRDNIGRFDNVGNGELRALIGGILNHTNAHGNDAEKILAELLLGDGIDGVELVGLDGDSFTIAASTGGNTDYLVFENDAAEEAIAAVDARQGLSAGGSGFDLNLDGKSQFAILDLSDPDASIRVGASGKLTGELDVGNSFTAGDLAGFLDAVLLGEGYAGAQIIDVDGDSIAVQFEGWRGAKDTLLITGIADALEVVSAGPLDDFIKKGFDQQNFEIDGPTNVPDGSLLDSFDFGNQLNNNKGEAPAINRLLDALVKGGGSISDADETIALVGVDSDSFTFSYENPAGAIDIFVYDFG